MTYLNIDSVLNCDADSNPRIKKISITKNNGVQHLIKYNKNSLRNQEDFDTYKLFRSMVLFNDKLLSVSPGKSMNYERFKETYCSSECYAEEFVEGTMINLYFSPDESEWQISTRSNLGANNVYFTKGKIEKEHTFSSMFYDVCKSCNINIELFPKNYCYSFVIQHPNNRIVKRIDEKRLYLIEVNEIEDNSHFNKIINLSELSDIFFQNKMKIFFPEKYKFDLFEDLETMANNYDTFEKVGIMIYSKKDNMRTKLRNPKYEHVRRLRGNQPKLEYHFLTLKKENKTDEYLKYYDEDTPFFIKYNKKLNEFSNSLLIHYVDCFIRKTKHLREFPFEYKNHLYQLHENYKQTREKISKKVIDKYIERLEVPKLMFSLNYKYRK
jgi:hypothetical protein